MYERKSTQTSSGGIGLSGALLIVFIVLKLTHVINWSWWWVMSPLWIPCLIFIVGLAIYLAYMFWKKKKRSVRKSQ